MKKHGLPGLTALLSSNWNNGAYARAFNLNLNNADSNVNRNIGTRLPEVIFFAELTCCLDRPCLLAKHSNKKPCIGRGGNALEDSGISQRRGIP